MAKVVHRFMSMLIAGAVYDTWRSITLGSVTNLGTSQVERLGQDITDNPYWGKYVVGWVSVNIKMSLPSSYYRGFVAKAMKIVIGYRVSCPTWMELLLIIN